MITRRQQMTLNFVKEFIIKNSYAPTVTEIASGLGLISRGVVHRYLKALAAAGEIHMTPRRHRNIRIVCRDPNRTLAVKGKISKDKPIEAILDSDYIDIGSIFIGDRRFGLRVQGDFMRDEGIVDGDLVICDRVNSAINGQVAVVLIDNQCTVIRKWQSNTDGTVTLCVPNKQQQAVTYAINRLEFKGIYMGLIRYGEALP